jgi:hypothetical protein
VLDLTEVKNATHSARRALQTDDMQRATRSLIRAVEKLAEAVELEARHRRIVE